MSDSFPQPIKMVKRDINDVRHTFASPGLFPPNGLPSDPTPGIPYQDGIAGINFQEIIILAIFRPTTDALGTGPDSDPVGQWHDDPTVLYFLCSCDGYMMYLPQNEFEPQWLRYSTNL